MVGATTSITLLWKKKKHKSIFEINFILKIIPVWQSTHKLNNEMKYFFYQC